MTNSFSERQGIIKLNSINPNDMPTELRNRLWNVVKNYIDNKFHGRNTRDVVIERIWDEFFKQDIDKLEGRDNSYI